MTVTHDPAAALPRVTLVLGGARSGKSRHAEALIEAAGGRRVYLATATAGDGEMADRIAAHRARRGDTWETVEAPIDLAGALQQATAADAAVLVDCLTLWLSNLMMAERDVGDETARLIAALPALSGPVVFVSNEVGLGIVPDNALARRFRDEAGRLHQAVAEIADRVVFMVAGLPISVKPALAGRI